ncbi:MAG: MFS transporter [Pseudomonadota bacterium]
MRASSRAPPSIRPFSVTPLRHRSRPAVRSSASGSAANSDVGAGTTDSTKTATATERRTFSIPRLMLFAAPAFPAAALTLPLGAYLPPYYAEASGLSLATVGLIFMLARFWDIITDPLMGALSDRTRTRWGRRRPWIFASGPVLALGAWALFFPPAAAGGVWLIGSLFVAYVGFTMLTISHYAWAGDLSHDAYVRSKLQGAIVIVGIAGTLGAMILPAIVEAGAANAMRARVEAMGAFALVLLAPAILVSILSTREPSSVVTDASSSEEPHRRAIFLQIRTALGRRPFRNVLIADFAQGIAGGMLLSTFVFFAGAWLGLADRTGLLLLIFFASGVVCVPLWVVVSRTLGKARTIALSSLLTVPIIAAFFVIPKESLVAAGIVQALFGSTMGVWIFLTRSIVADLVDDEERAHGDRPAGIYYALATLTTKLGQAIAVGIGYVLLDALNVSLTEDGGTGLTAAFCTLLPPIAGHLIIAGVMLRTFPQHACEAAPDARMENA